jgi:hypothetical protein
MATTHPAGTNVDTIRGFDRSTKVRFHCPKHPEGGEWMSKDPFASSWFPAPGTNELTAQPCDCPTREHVTTAEYTSNY